jgi:hypothetical protein
LPDSDEDGDDDKNYNGDDGVDNHNVADDKNDIKGHTHAALIVIMFAMVIKIMVIFV